jgi:serine/threonine protein phosphatase PrpC
VPGRGDPYGGRMQVAARTEVGHVRSRNEDALLVAEADGVVAVFDGLGGHPAGDVASSTAAASLRESGLTAASSAEDLVAALQSAHDAVSAAADGDPGRTGMATTAVVATLAGSTARVAHVGDSRAYLRDTDGRLHQITRDHGMGGYITQALGLDRGVDPDLTEVATPPGTRLLLCSDGLSNMVDAADIGALLGAGDAEAACDALVEAALERGGIDNVTVVVAVL